MLSFFRRFTNSRVGVFVTFGVLGIIALAFALGDVTGLRSDGNGSLSGGSVATAGSARVTPNDLRQTAQGEIEAFRQRQPSFDASQYVAAGGLDAAVERLVTGMALEQFGRDQGLVVSKRSVDGQIASLPGLRGPTGQFDQKVYEAILAQRRLTDAQVRSEIARGISVQRLIFPSQRTGYVPAQVALPYASLLLERRSGQVALVPTAAVAAGPAPTDQEVQSFYGRNLARYTVPQRRVIRYALVTPAQAAGQAGTPTDAEVQRAYAADRAKYAPTQRRTIAQVIVASQSDAQSLAARVRGGQSIADAARAAGLEASTQSGAQKDAYAALAGRAAADAAFAAADKGVFGPVRGPLGFVVGRVERIETVAGRTIDQARPEIVAALTKQKAADALNRARDAVDDLLGDNSTFDEVVADRKLTPVTTRPLLATGADPDRPDQQPDAALVPLAQTAFTMEEGDGPQLVPVGTDGGFAVVALGAVTPAAPRPLTQVREQVARDFAADRARTAARSIATGIVSRAGKGAFPAALASAGVSLPSPRRLSLSRSQLAANPQGVEPAVALLFSMAPGTAKLLEAPDRKGWLVVKLDAIQRGDARGNAQLVRATRTDLGRAVGAEYAEQFARAARSAVGARVDPAAVAQVRRDLTGQGAGDN